MNKLKFTIAIAIGLAAGIATNNYISPAQAGMWETLSGAFATTVPSKLFAIEAQGSNIRGYIFENPANVGKMCVQTATNKGNSGLSCDWSK